MPDDRTHFGTARQRIRQRLQEASVMAGIETAVAALMRQDLTPRA